MSRQFLAAGSLVLMAVAIACGGGSSPSTPSTPAVAATPTPVANATPNPSGTPLPSPSPCTQGLCEAPVTNTAPVDRSFLRIYFVKRPDGTILDPTPDPKQGIVSEKIPVGWTIKFDVTGRDKDGKETYGPHQDIKFFFDQEDMVETTRRGDFQIDVVIKKPGKFIAYATFNGIGSNDLHFTFVE